MLRRFQKLNLKTNLLGTLRTTVYHPQKPMKIRVVFNCSARFQDTSLNDALLTGAVLCRFGKGPIAIMCDVERMFYQLHVAKEHQDKVTLVGQR